MNSAASTEAVDINPLCGLQTASPDGKPARRRGEAYEQPTPEKIEIGNRLRIAREVAGISLTEAAESLGYSQPVQLSLMETGSRMPTLRVMLHYADLYNTTMDFLCGRLPEIDRDPALGAQAMIASRVSGEVNRLIESMVSLGVDAVRELRPDQGVVLRMSGLVLEASLSLDRMRKLNPSLDEDVRGLATVVTKLDLAATLAEDYVGHVARVRRKLASAAVDLGLKKHTGAATDAARDAQGVDGQSRAKSGGMLDGRKARQQAARSVSTIGVAP